MSPTHEFDGEQYKKASAHQTSWGEIMVESLPLMGTEHILDIGCGDGRVTAKIASRVPDGQVLGIDASKSMIASAKQYETKNLHFCVEEVSKLTFYHKFDVVFSHAALHWVLDHDILLEKIYAVLRPGGYARLNFAGKGTCPRLIKVLKELMKQSAFSKYFTNFIWPWYMPSTREYQIISELSPFRNVDISKENKKRIFPSEDSLIKWIDQPCLVPFLEVLDKNNKQQFRDEVIHQMLSKTRQLEGNLSEEFCRIDVFAKKI